MQRARRGGLDVPTVYFVEIPRGRIYMERVHGVTAKAYLASEFVTPADRASLAAAIGEGIARLHNSGLVHGDLTTSNIMIRGLTHDATGALTGAESLVHATDSSTDASPAAGAAAEEAPIVADAAPAAAAAATSPAGTSGGVAVASSAPIALPLKRKASDFVAGSASAGATGGAAAGASGTPTASDAADTAALPPPAPFPYKVVRCGTCFSYCCSATNALLFVQPRASPAPPTHPRTLPPTAADLHRLWPCGEQRRR